MHQLLSHFTTRRRLPLFTWGALFLIAALACQPLLGPPPRGHDALLHYYRIPVVSELWQNGLLFSRWAPDLVFGYGSPLFNFYPPLSAYLLTALYWLFGQNGPLAYNLSYALALALTTVSMFLLGRHLFGSLGGLLASATYTLAPHVLLQTYSRGSLSNALALAFAPLAALALLRVGRQASPRRVALAACAVALVLLSHTASGLLFVPVLLLFALGAARLLYRTAPAPVIAALLLGLALAAFTWLPGLAEIGATRYADSVAVDNVEFRDHFAAALAWPRQTVAGLAKTPLPHSIGMVQLLQGAAAAVLAPLLWWRRRRTSSAQMAAFVGLCGLLGLGALFFATPPSAWFWQHIEPLRELQFPWRLLDAPVFLLALAAAWWAPALRARWRPWLLGLALMLIFLNALPHFYPARLVTLPRQPTLSHATNVQQERGILGLTAWGEYSSAEVARWPQEPPFPGADRGAALPEKIRLPTGASLRSARGGLLFASWELFLPRPTVVSLSVHYFPGWRAAIDGLAAPIATDERGRMHVALPAGAHELTVDWTRTPARWLADGLSLLALVAVAWLARPRLKREPRVSPPPGAIATADATAAAAADAPRWLLGLLAVLLILKVAVFDAHNTPLVLHPDAQHVPATSRPAHGDFGVFRLLGYEHAPPDELTLYWYAPRQVQSEHTVRVTVTDATGVPLAEIENPYPGDNPTTGWGPGLVIRDVYRLPLGELPAPAAYNLSVAVLHPDGDEPLPVLDGPPGATTVGVGTRKRPPPSLTVPAQARALDAVFGDALALTAALIPQTARVGEPLPLTLYWRPHAPVTEDYTVFVHLLRSDGEFVAAYDTPPLAGLYPTGAWEPGEIIADARELDLDVPPGDYLLQVGLYQLQSGERLPVSGADAAGDDHVIIRALTIRPGPLP